MTLITGGELLARALANEGVRFVFGLPCPEIDPLLVRLPAHGIRFVPVRHDGVPVLAISSQHRAGMSIRRRPRRSRARTRSTS